MLSHADPAVANPESVYALTQKGEIAAGARVVFGVTLTGDVERAIRTIRGAAGAGAMGASPSAVGCFVAEAIRTLDAQVST
jgi:hypothetical protein